MTKLKKWIIGLLAFIVVLFLGWSFEYTSPYLSARAEEADSTDQTSNATVALTSSNGNSDTVQTYSNFSDAVQAISADTSSTSFVLKLLSNVELAQTATFSKSVTCNLDGYLLQYAGATGTSGAVIEVTGGTFTLLDTNTTLQEHLYESDGGAYTFTDSSVMRFGESLSGGVVCGGTDGGVKVSGGEFILSGGTIAGNTSSTNGGGVYVANVGTFTMSGGSIVGNSAQTGAGVYTLGTTSISGGKITDNYAETSSAGVNFAGGTLTLSGTAFISENYLSATADGFAAEENIALNGRSINVGKLESGAKIGLTPTNKDDLSQDANVLSGFATNNPNANPASYFTVYIQTDSNGNNTKGFKLAIDEQSGNVIWKELTLIEKPAQVKTVTFNNQTAVVPVASSAYEVIGIDDTVKSANSYELAYRLTDTDTTAWSDGSQDDITLYYTIAKLGVEKPTADATKLVYADGQYTYDTGSQWITAEVSDKTVEGGTHIVKLNLAYPDDTYWGTEASENVDTAAITFTFRLGGANASSNLSNEASLGEGDYLWLIVVLAAILIIEVVAVCTYWQNRKEDSDRSNALAPLPLLLAVMPIYQLALIIVLAAAIVLVAIYHIYLLIKNKDEWEEPITEQATSNGNSEEKNGVHSANDNYIFNSEMPRESYVTYAPPMPMPQEEPKAQEHEEAAQSEVTQTEVTQMDAIQSAPADDVELAAAPKQIFMEEPLDDDTEEMAIPAGATAAEQIAITDENGEVTEVLKSVDYQTNTAYVVRYKKSFAARLSQSWDESKNYYTNLKNEALRYKLTRSKVTWDYDCISVDLQPIIKFDIRGKTLCLYFALDPDEFKGTKYRVERSEIKKCEDVPCLYRIKDDTCEQNAMELIAKVAELFGLDRGRKKTENYFAPYEDTSVLVKKGLITEYIARERYNEFLRKSNKQQADKARQSAPQTAHEEPRVATVNFNDDDIEEVRSVDKATGKTIITRFNKSFTAKLSQASDELKSFYATLKNEILSYAKTKSTVWWNGDSIHTDNKTIAKFAIHDNVLCLYLALRPSDYLDSNYQVEQAEGKRYAHVPCMYRIKNARRERLAIDLIADLARKCNLMAEKQQNENYYLPYRSTDQLIQDGLIKQLDSE